MRTRPWPEDADREVERLRAKRVSLLRAFKVYLWARIESADDRRRISGIDVKDFLAKHDAAREEDK